MGINFRKCRLRKLGRGGAGGGGGGAAHRKQNELKKRYLFSLFDPVKSRSELCIV